MDGIARALHGQGASHVALARLGRLAACAAVAQEAQVLSWWRLAWREAQAAHRDCVALGLEREAREILLARFRPS